MDDIIDGSRTNHVIAARDSRHGHASALVRIVGAAVIANIDLRNISATAAVAIKRENEIRELYTFSQWLSAANSPAANMQYSVPSTNVGVARGPGPCRC